MLAEPEMATRLDEIRKWRDGPISDVDTRERTIKVLSELLERLLAERELLVAEHRAALDHHPHANKIDAMDCEEDGLCAAWNRVEAFR